MTGPTGVAVRRRFLPVSYSDHQSSGIRFARASTVAAIQLPTACATVCANVAVCAPCNVSPGIGLNTVVLDGGGAADNGA